MVSSALGVGILAVPLSMPKISTPLLFGVLFDIVSSQDREYVKNMPSRHIVASFVEY
jgi:hypothetical protein